MMHFKVCWDGLPTIVFWDSLKIERYEKKKEKQQKTIRYKF